ncbi:unnamed protein product [Bursaphelenchus okinawaensis]|uniref:Uncharacterized protein n=1 Tax=Bursaphelenchus okinawaensis TaxID=465554 RepID=A0A811K9F6_9BILA|nr:unnamed protein product [Bursaphelenchus okinawaensis]CAG9097273.1 unnamed protein product [Bursaphelenchus okinawaensis]
MRFTILFAVFVIVLGVAEAGIFDWIFGGSGEPAAPAVPETASLSSLRRKRSFGFGIGFPFGGSRRGPHGGYHHGSSSSEEGSGSGDNSAEGSGSGDYEHHHRHHHGGSFHRHSGRQ